MIDQAPNSAPETYAYCPRCATPLETRAVTDKLRRVCPECDFIYFTDPKVGVGVLVVKEGKVLLVRRTMRPERGKWSIPAGFLDRGEDPEVVAVREAREETGLRVEIDDLVDVYYNPPSPEGGASVFILYRARLLGGELEAGDDADAAGFFSPDDLPEIAFDSTYDAVRLVRDEAGDQEE
ncbi:MAG: NUDIX domain-containing protein [Candidatus Promineifilaceae bacterium]|nr:NUDIX domain-containing protein [Candidatus Promineifilaceae bacterium]